MAREEALRKTIEKNATILLNTLPTQCFPEKKMNLILDGGAFNGIYMLGILYYLKEMEKREIVKIEKISGVSVGSICAFIYMLDKLHIMNDYFQKVRKRVKKDHHLGVVLSILDSIEQIVPENVCEMVNERLYISYYDTTTCRKITKSKYKTKREIIEAIKKSCYIPYLDGESLFYKNRFSDGYSPFIFPRTREKTTLFIDLTSRWKDMLCIKNETSTFYRTYVGMTDIHHFFLRKGGSRFCFYMEDTKIWIYFRISLERLIWFFLYYVFLLKRYVERSIHRYIGENIL
jgi:hypothetical protein